MAQLKLTKFSLISFAIMVLPYISIYLFITCIIGTYLSKTPQIMRLLLFVFHQFSLSFCENITRVRGSQFVSCQGLLAQLSNLHFCQGLPQVTKQVRSKTKSAEEKVAKKNGKHLGEITKRGEGLNNMNFKISLCNTNLHFSM